MERQGNWAYSSPFALNFDIDGTQGVSNRFRPDRVNVVPVISEFDVNSPVPSGSRHLTTHPSFVGTLASGRGLASFSFDDLDMQSVNIGPGSGISCTKVFLFRVNEFDCPDNSRIANIKVWASDTSDFLTDDTHRVVFETYRTWQSGLALPVEFLTRPDKALPKRLPEFQNLYRQDGKTTIWGSGDADVSEWIYTAVAASGTLPLGQYGLTPSSGFRLRVTYELDNLFTLRD